MTDADLIRHAAAGDSLAFQLLYERHWSAIYRFAWFLTKSVSDAEDITQECFLTLVRRPKCFDPARSQLQTWLKAVARNQYFQRCRNQAHHRNYETDEAFETPERIDDELIRTERADAVRRAVDALPEVQREALYLFEFEGLSLADTAAILGIEPNAVKARLYRAREQLRRLLSPVQLSTNQKMGDRCDG